MQASVKHRIQSDIDQHWEDLLDYLGLKADSSCGLPGLMMKMKADVVAEGVLLEGCWAVSYTSVEAIVTKYEPVKRRVHLSVLDSDGVPERVYKYRILRRGEEDYLMLTIGQNEYFGLIGWSLSLFAPILLPLKYLMLKVVAKTSMP